MNRKKYPLNFLCHSLVLLFSISQSYKALAQEVFFYRKNDAKTCHVMLPKRMQLKHEVAVQKLLSENLYQEALWYLNRIKEKENAKKVKSHLFNLLKTADLANYARPLQKLGGATSPLLYILPCDVKVVFKEKSSHPSSNYRSEVGSYLIDDFFGFNMVPMTIFRTLKGEKGSLQYFVKSITEVTESYRKSPKLHIFDYIIANKDRNSGNILLLNNNEVAIDHGLSLRAYNPTGDNLINYDKFRMSLNIKADIVRSQRSHPRKNPQLFNSEKKLLKRLYKASYKELNTLLAGTLKKKNIELLHKKIAKLNKYLKENKKSF